MKPAQEAIKMAEQQPAKKSLPKQALMAQRPMKNKMAPKKPIVRKPRVQVRAPRPGEPYFDYCIQKANQLERAVYCSDGSFNDVVVAERGIVDRETALLKFCALRATTAERQRYCAD